MREHEKTNAVNPYISVEEILAAAGGRWHNGRMLAAATRRGDGPQGRVLLTANKAVYLRESWETWVRGEELRRAEKLAAMQARAAVARAALAAKRAVQGSEADLLGAALAAVIGAVAESEVRP